MVKTQFSSTIKTLRSNGGGEYTSKSFESFLTSNGINHQISCPYTPQQNGLVERKHRHLIETTITPLSQASLPSSYLSFVVQSTMTLINLLPIATLGFSSPWYKLHGQHPDISSLKIFGCACYSFLKPYTKHKLNHRTTKCLFLGYSKGYLCLDLLTHTLYTYKHVLFNEAKFPFSYTPSSASISHTPNPNVWLSNLLYLHSSNQPSILGPYSTSTSHSTNPGPNLTSQTLVIFPYHTLLKPFNHICLYSCYYISTCQYHSLHTPTSSNFIYTYSFTFCCPCIFPSCYHCIFPSYSHFLNHCTCEHTSCTYELTSYDHQIKEWDL